MGEQNQTTSKGVREQWMLGEGQDTVSVNKDTDELIFFKKLSAPKKIVSKEEVSPKITKGVK